MREPRLLLLVAIGIGLTIGAVSDVVSYVECGPPEPPSARILIVDNSLNRPIYVPEREWKPFLGDVPYDVVHVPGGEEIPPVDDYTHIIISGSTASLVDPPAWVAVEAELVTRAADRGLSILGSCFGHQMLVYALSGSEFVQRAAAPEIGWIEVEMTAEDWLFADSPNPWHAFAWHYDQVVDPPAPWRVLGRSTTCAVHVIRYGDAPIWGLQSHPETKSCTAKLLLFLDKLVFDWNSEEICAALLQKPRDDRIIGSVMERFLEGEP
ncbi:type 1 glutamine amidotransferase [Candidatus Bipolaricaulota bacterium]|nr:type 1 glutamine amidotransferase [Candidatus Bipolaricaulota bacterium]